MQKIDELTFQQKSTLLLIALHENSATIHDIVSADLFPADEIWETLELLIKSELVVKGNRDETTLFTLSPTLPVGDILRITDDAVWKLLFDKTTFAQKYIHISPFTLYSYNVAVAYSRLYTPPHFKDGDIYAVRAFAIAAFAQVIPLLDRESLERGIEIAVAHGETAVQAILYSCLDVSLFPDKGEAFALFDRAKELASLQDDYRVMIFVMKSITFRMAIRGELKKTIQYYESFMDELHPIINSLDYASLDSYSQRIVAAAYTSNGLIAFCYYMTGQYARSVTILFEMLERADQMDNARLRESARAYLAHIFADQGDREKARYYSKGNLEFWQSNKRESVFSWHATIAQASLAMSDGSDAAVVRYLEMGHKYRMRGGFPHHYGEILMKVLEWHAIQGGTPVKGISLNGEIKRLLAWPDIHMQGVAYLYKARKMKRDGEKNDKIAKILRKGISLLRKSGALPSLKKSIDFLCEIISCDKKDLLKKESEEITEKTLYFDQKALVSTNNRLFIKRMERLVLEMNNLSTIFENGRDPWNHIANQILHFTGAEKCAIIESDLQFLSHKNSVLAQIGTSKPWLDEVFTFVRDKMDRELEMPRDTLIHTRIFNGEKSILVVIPYFSDKVQKSGVICLESLHLTHSFWAKNRGSFAKIGNYFTTVYENIHFLQLLQDKKVTLEKENLYYRKHSETGSFGDIIGTSKEISHLKELIEKAAPLDTTVLIQGETGSGKELIAHEIYKNSSRKNGPFVVANVASISNELISSALFGHERGAFTGAVSRSKGLFELADGGTIFLDEIGDMSLETQVHLLRVLQEGVFKRIGSEKDISSDFRLIVATNKNLLEEVEKGAFRKDLYYRISVFPITSPPLRQRAEDIPLLALFFMEKFSKSIKKKFTNIRQDDMHALLAYHWPGNVRELSHIIERACILSSPPVLEVATLTHNHFSSAQTSSLKSGSTLDDTIRNTIKNALLSTNGKVHGKQGAAALLNIKPSTLYSKIEKYGLKSELAHSTQRSKKQ
ncbi:sigma-54-dependent Fis family transcriptional regulator [bacterium]|nr:sigma-54-dependent Fis family transcriptional regulator [bacterium]